MLQNIYEGIKLPKKSPSGKQARIFMTPVRLVAKPGGNSKSSTGFDVWIKKAGL